ncbi:MAG: tol-pal system protein YbgF [Candidatus Acidiferrales bacterium]
MRTRWIVLGLGLLFLGALCGSALAPTPVGAVSKEMIQLQQSVDQLTQAQQSLRSAVDANNATLRTLIQQATDSVNQLNGKMALVEKTVQEVQANTGARIDTMTTQTQGLSDNVQDIQARVGKLAQQMNDVQGLLQSIDAKISGGAPPPSAAAAPGADGAASDNGAGGGNPGALAPIPADTLYQNALRDFTGGRYDLSRQEFSDYMTNFPTNDLASNAQFYLGEIDYAQGNYKAAIGAYTKVIAQYPRSFKVAASQLKKAQAEIKLGNKQAGIRDLHEVVRKYPGSDEARQAQARLRELGVATR